MTMVSEQTILEFCNEMKKSRNRFMESLDQMKKDFSRSSRSHQQQDRPLETETTSKAMEGITPKTMKNMEEFNGDDDLGLDSVGRLIIAIFDGENTEWWVSIAERIFSRNQLSEAAKIEAATACFDVKTWEWFQWLDQNRAILTWKELKRQMLYRFCENKIPIYKEINQQDQTENEWLRNLKEEQLQVSTEEEKDHHRIAKFPSPLKGSIDGSEQTGEIEGNFKEELKRKIVAEEQLLKIVHLNHAVENFMSHLQKSDCPFESLAKEKTKLNLGAALGLNGFHRVQVRLNGLGLILNAAQVHEDIFKQAQGKRRAHEKTRRRRNNKVKVGDDFSSNRNTDFELVSKIFKNASEDILLEIFLRLPNYRSAILFGSVCRPWHFVISQPHFIPSFIRHHDDHQDRYILPCTIIFRSSDRYVFRGVQCYQPICKLFSEEPMFLHENASSRFLDFLPSPMIVRASFDDLLLVSPGSRGSRDYYICNPVTKQWFQLPEMLRRMEVAGFALVCMPDDYSTKQQLGAQYIYKVVLLQSPIPDVVGGDEDTIRISGNIFCSKSGCWSRSIFYYPRPEKLKLNACLGIETCKGILYWLENEYTPAWIIALDLFNGSRCSVIDFPDDFGPNSCGKASLGVVGGGLRLLRVFKTTDEECCFVMKVWELKYDKDDSTSWVLIHQINMKRESGVNNTEEMVSMLAVHPNNADVVFMIWGKHLFQYKITQGMYEKVDELKEPILRYERVLSIPFMHPAWPTPVPSHPPSI